MLIYGPVSEFRLRDTLGLDPQAQTLSVKPKGPRPRPKALSQRVLGIVMGDTFPNHNKAS